MVLICSFNWSGTYFVNHQIFFEWAVVPCLSLSISEIIEVCCHSLLARLYLGSRYCFQHLKSRLIQNSREMGWNRCHPIWDVLSSPLQGGILAGLGLQRSCKCSPTAVSSYIGLSYWDRNIMFAYDHLLLLVLTLIWHPLLQWSLSFEKGNEAYSFPWRLNTLQSLILCNFYLCWICIK